MDSLIKLDPIDKSLKRLKEDFDSLSYFIYTLVHSFSTKIEKLSYNFEFCVLL